MPEAELPDSETPKESESNAETPIDFDKEYGGPKGKEPTRYGDWEKKGRCIDF